MATSLIFSPSRFSLDLKTYDCFFFKDAHRLAVEKLIQVLPKGVHWEYEFRAARKDLSRCYDWPAMPWPRLKSTRLKIKYRNHIYRPTLAFNKLVWAALFPDYVLCAYPFVVSTELHTSGELDLNPMKNRPLLAWNMPQRCYAPFVGVWGDTAHWDEPFRQDHSEFINARRRYHQYLQRVTKVRFNLPSLKVETDVCLEGLEVTQIN